MILSDEILKLTLMKEGTVMPIKQGGDITFLCKNKGFYAVAIPFDDERVLNEPFVGITLLTNILNYDNKQIKVLYLNMVDKGDLKKFSYIAAEFIDIKNRESILKDPYIWVDAWNEMFGNSKKKYLISDVVAELISLKNVYKNDKTARWMGPEDGTHDIVCKDGVVEVKSTTNKTNTYVTINSRFQVDSKIKEKIFFVRLEPKPYAECIDSLVLDLISLGYPKNDLENNLSKMGYRSGNRTRKHTYSILEINSYDVNENNFPVLNLNELNRITLTKNIIGFKLILDLSSIPFVKIK